MSLEHPLSVYVCVNEADKRSRMIESLLPLNSSLAFICGRKRTAELQPLTRICLASPEESAIKVTETFKVNIKVNIKLTPCLYVHHCVIYKVGYRDIEVESCIVQEFIFMVKIKNSGAQIKKFIP